MANENQPKYCSMYLKIIEKLTIAWRLYYVWEKIHSFCVIEIAQVIYILKVHSVISIYGYYVIAEINDCLKMFLFKYFEFIYKC